jgi:glyoxylase-like metal-dependent hydrolase (beta-lactamase superfamily II)
MTVGWVEVGERVFVRRYAFYDQNIVAVLGRDEALVLDTRTTHAQARETLDDLRELGSHVVGIVVNSHGHYDHAFGNRVFRPAPIWGHERCAAMLTAFGERMRAAAAAEVPDIREDLAAVVIDPPDRTFLEQASICLDDGREVSLRYLGRGHTDNDVVLHVEGADVLCAGDLVENGATPYFGDGYPMDWPATAEALLALVGPSTVVVPGHGDHAGLGFVESQLAGFRAVADAGRRVHAGEATLDDVLPLVPYPAAEARQPVERAVAQLRGELDAGVPAEPESR